MSRFNFLTLTSDESLLVAVPVSMVAHEVGEHTLGIDTFEIKSMEYELNSYNTAPKT
jgi:hypothetical protein